MFLSLNLHLQVYYARSLSSYPNVARIRALITVVGWISLLFEAAIHLVSGGIKFEENQPPELISTLGCLS